MRALQSRRSCFRSPGRAGPVPSRDNKAVIKSGTERNGPAATPTGAVRYWLAESGASGADESERGKKNGRASVAKTAVLVGAGLVVAVQGQ